VLAGVSQALKCVSVISAAVELRVLSLCTAVLAAASVQADVLAEALLFVIVHTSTCSTRRREL
jgi:hypothetical protein